MVGLSVGHAANTFSANDRATTAAKNATARTPSLKARANPLPRFGALVASFRTLINRTKYVHHAHPAGPIFVIVVTVIGGVGLKRESPQTLPWRDTVRHESPDRLTLRSTSLVR